jgi:putative phosphoesterase
MLRRAEEWTVKWAILADTHIGAGRALSREVWRQLERVDGILHAGDFTSAEFYRDLKALAPLSAVAGNCDLFDFELAHLPHSLIVTCGHLRVGITHGYGLRTPLAQAQSAFAGEELDLVVFGHSHMPYNEKVGAVQYFNPGSPTQGRGNSRRSMGFLSVEKESFTVEHVYFGL